MSPEFKQIFSPCKDCKDRYELCHSMCEKYKDYREYRDYISNQRIADYSGAPKIKHLKKK